MGGGDDVEPPVAASCRSSKDARKGVSSTAAPQLTVGGCHSPPPAGHPPKDVASGTKHLYMPSGLLVDTSTAMRLTTSAEFHDSVFVRLLAGTGARPASTHDASMTVSDPQPVMALFGESSLKPGKREGWPWWRHLCCRHGG